MPAFARVLVVDDDVDRRFLVGAFLKQIGHDPVLAESGEAALRLVDREDFDLAISTVGIRGMEGMNFGKLIQGVRPGIPVILVAGPEDRVETTLESDMVALLAPVSLETMESAVTEILQQTRAAKRHGA